MKIKNLHVILSVAAALFAPVALTGCFTGVERTPRIKSSSADSRKTPLTPEQTLLETARPQEPALWQPGKPFLITSGRLAFSFSPTAVAAELHPGDTIRYRNMAGEATLAGDSVTDVIFSLTDGRNLTHRVEAPLSRVRSAERLVIPFTVDLDVVDAARQALVGRSLWTRRMGNDGLKYQQVTISGVRPGNADYPLLVEFGSDSLFLVVEGRSYSSRTLDNYFSLTDPRNLYPHISDENWELICRGRIAAEMTREECRLSLGEPADIRRDVTYAGLVERWTYENGIYLIFTDGILTSFRL